MTTVTLPGIPGLTDHELRDAWCAGAVGLDELAAECERRDKAQRAERRSASARAASRRRHAEWESAAYAQYEQAEAYCRGNMLSAAGKRAGRDAWPMLWQGGEETARRLCSDEMVTFWDYVSPRVPGPGQYAAAKRAASADQEARAPLSAMEAAGRAASDAARATVPPMAPGAIARYTAALSAFGAHVDDLAARMEARLERINGGNQR